jgi:hypothetical protein
LVESVPWDERIHRVFGAHALPAQSIPTIFSATFDSASDTHLLSLEAAEALLTEKKESNLRILGVSGSTTRAELAGHLILEVEAPDKTTYHVDLGLAHGMSTCPMNLLSVALLINSGGIVHFERDNSYFQPYPNASKIPFQQNNGMFQLDARRGVLSPTSAAETTSSFHEDGQVFGASASLPIWHRRLRHISHDLLVRIANGSAVDGLKIKGKPQPSKCNCDACKQAKIRRSAVPSEREFCDPASFVGHTVSTDVKSLPYNTFKGYKYCLVFVDHYSRLTVSYYMRHKSETTQKLKDYLREMRRLGVQVRTIQSDRGSEYFSQVGETRADRDRKEHEFTAYCHAQEPKIHHVVTAIEMKANLAEVFFREHFRAANAMLWEARLSPAFWADAVAYSSFLYNRTPNSHTGMHTTPLTLVTGEKPNWSKIRTFGCDVFQHIPNNPYYKIPGIPRGRRLIFVGFDSKLSGFKCFDPETRRYHSTANLYFQEDFSYRIDALRHHDQRRALLKNEEDQPVILDDFDDPNSSAVRSLYLDPDAPQMEELSFKNASLGGETSRESLAAEEPDTPPTTTTPTSTITNGPLNETAIAAEHARGILREGVVLRPLRLQAVGVEAPYNPEDQRFLRYAQQHTVPVLYLMPCPKKKDSSSRRRYLKYMHATTLTEAHELGASRDDIVWDYRRGFIAFPRHENDMSGHVHCAFEFAEQHGHVHVLQAARRRTLRTFETDIKLANVFHATTTTPTSTTTSKTFHQQLETVFEPEVIEKQLEDRQSMLRFADEQMAKVLNTNTTPSRIDFALASDPTRLEEALDAPDAAEWRKAMDDEMHSMSRFGVYRRVPKSAANGRQVLGCKWVLKRKRDQFGQITRYRARLVAQGFLQRPYDSYDPDATYSPVVHRDTLRLFLSLCAAENLHVYQTDVKAAFLQADLAEKIYLRAPPGYNYRTPQGEPEVLELSKAIYGIKQASSCFWDSLQKHLVSKGYEPILGDPCLFRKVLPDGRMIFICTYVDDLITGVSDPSLMDQFLGEIRERFVIEEGEGKPVDYLLGIAVSQNITEGTIFMNMENAITKLCESILTKEELTKSDRIDTPMLQTPLLHQKERTVPSNDFDYLSVVGSLLHLTNCVRFDISYAVGVLARHAATPGAQHVRAVKRVLQYLYNTRTLGITYSRPELGRKNIPFMYEGAKHPLDNGTNRLQTFADSDYAADETRRSTMGTVVMMNGGPISWSSVLGKTVALSTCEAEVNAAVSAAKDALHLQRMLFDLGYAQSSDTLQIAEDNSACIAQAESGLRHVRKAKHYEVRLRFLQQLVVDREIEFVYCPTDRMLADFFTKPLDSEKFQRFRNYLVGEH